MSADIFMDIIKNSPKDNLGSHGIAGLHRAASIVLRWDERRTLSNTIVTSEILQQIRAIVDASLVYFALTSTVSFNFDNSQRNPSTVKRAADPASICALELKDSQTTRERIVPSDRFDPGTTTRTSTSTAVLESSAKETFGGLSPLSVIAVVRTTTAKSAWDGTGTI
jgi:hypothetical protein